MDKQMSPSAFNDALAGVRTKKNEFLKMPVFTSLIIRISKKHDIIKRMWQNATLFSGRVLYSGTRFIMMNEKESAGNGA